jgi:hypothetical protein
MDNSSVGRILGGTLLVLISVMFGLIYIANLIG